MLGFSLRVNTKLKSSFINTDRLRCRHINNLFNSFERILHKSLIVVHV